jgi:DNA/RNA-binding domain of Phe-tRNA-synthetase-like protein
MMDDPKKVQEFLGQITGKAVATLTVWADANQRVLHEMVEFGAASAKETARLYAELQQSAIDVLRDSQAEALGWQAAWQDSAKDPVQLYQKAFKVFETQAQAVTRSAERLQTSVEQAGKGIQETYTAVVAKLKDVYAQS